MRLWLHRSCWLHRLWPVGHSHLCVSRPNGVRLRYGSHSALSKASPLRLLAATLGQLHVSQALRMVTSFRSQERSDFLAHQRAQRGAEDDLDLATTASLRVSGS